MKPPHFNKQNAKETLKNVYLGAKANKYFNEVHYSLDYGDGNVATPSQVINHCLEELALFEEYMGRSVTDYLKDIRQSIFESKNKNP